jgi:hypothetical protein
MTEFNMVDPEPVYHPDILQLLETTLPVGATPKEREEFARGLTLLADLLGEIGIEPEENKS